MMLHFSVMHFYLITCYTVDKPAESQTQNIVRLASYLQYLERSTPDPDDMGSNLLRGTWGTD